MLILKYLLDQNHMWFEAPLLPDGISEPSILCWENWLFLVITTLLNCTMHR